MLRKVKFLIVLLPGLNRNIFLSLVAAQNGVKTDIEKNDLSLGLGSFRGQLARLDNMNPLDLTIEKESKAESALCVISVKTFGKESVLTSLLPKKLVALSVGSINVD